jgi:putative ABC transport system permease protein
MRDLRHAIRQLLRAPAYTVVAALTLALGMGGTTAFYSVLDGVVLQQPPFPAAERLVTLENRRLHAPASDGRLARAEVVEYRARLRVFEGVAAWDLGRMTLMGTGARDGFAERVKVAGVTTNLLPTLGVLPARGRAFHEADLEGGAVVIISHGLWQTHFAGADDVLSRTLRLNGVEHAILGVMPPAFSYPEPQMTAWVPRSLRPRDASDRTDHYLGTVARLAPGVDLAAAERDLERVARELRRERPDAYPDPQWTIGAVSLRDRHYGHLRLPLSVLLAAAGSVLLIACVNVAIMALLRATTRRRELAIRVAIGAGWGALTRQLVLEAAVLSAVGAAGGLVLAQAGIAALQAFAPAGVPRLADVGLDAPAALVVGGTLIATTLIVGLAPAVVVVRAFEGGGISLGRASETRVTTRLRDTLTVVEVALAATLVVCSGLTMRSLGGLLRTDVGFETAGRVSFKTNLTERAYPDAERVAFFYDQLTARLAAIPGVHRLGAVSYLPLSGEGMTTAGSPAAAPESSAAPVGWAIVRGAYFETMGIGRLHGRAFDQRDRAGAPPVAIVDEVFARRFWPNAAAAVGQPIRIGTGPGAQIRTIVGVVRAVRHAGPARTAMPTAYAPQAQVYQRGMYTVLETVAPTAAVLAAARQALAAVDPNVPLYFAETSERRYHAAIALPRFVTGLVGAFSTMALVLAGVGIFGVTGYAVGQRRREFGIRLALGARRGKIGGLVLRRVALLVGVGLAAGSGLALVVGPALTKLLHDVPPDDPRAFALAAAALTVTALAAALVPVRAAVSVDPAITLKAE